MKDELIKGIKELRKKLSNIKMEEAKKMDEAKTKQHVVLYLLQTLGWNIFDEEEVVPEYKVEGQSVDYALKIKNDLKVFLEVKKIGEELENHQKQLLEYSFRQGVELAVLTNGRNWWFYLPLVKENWEERRFCTIDISQKDPEEIASKFIIFLSKESIETNKSIEEAKRRHEEHKKERKIKSILPKAWNEMLSEPYEPFIEAFSKKIEELCGEKPDVKTLKEFLSNVEIKSPSCKEEFYEKESSKSSREKGERRISREILRIAILQALIELGGKAETEKVLEKVHEKIKDKLTEDDYSPVSGGEPKWRNFARWERNAMVNEGLLKKDSPRGIWEITEKGREYLEKIIKNIQE